MKRIFTFITALFAMASICQAEETDNTFRFTDLQGNPVNDGAVITVNTINSEGQMIVPLKVENTSGEKAAVSMYEVIDAMPNGQWQTCAFGNCMQLESTGYSPKNIVAGNYNADIQTEWIPASGGYATWDATLQIHVFAIQSKVQFGELVETVGDEVIGYGPKVTVHFEYSNAAQEEAMVWWGYVGMDEVIGGIGTSKAITYDCASFYPGNDPDAGGKTIHSVRFHLPTANVSNVKVWIASSAPEELKTDVIDMVNVTNPVVGFNEVALSKPYTIGSAGVFVGYSFTVTKVEATADAYPVSCAGTDKKNALWLRLSNSGWNDYNGNGYGRLVLQLLLSGEFPYQNAVSTTSKDLGESIAAVGETTIVYLPLTNHGTKSVSSLDYTITYDGVVSSEYHVDLQNPISYGSTKVISMVVQGDETAGKRTKTLTITKVNGVANEYETTVEPTFTLSTLSEIVPKSVVVEEFTGTGCGWCPRGIVGMEKIRRTFGDKAIGIAIHRYNSDDAMYNKNYTQVSFSGAPSARINRGAQIDPYYGSAYDIADDINYELAIPAKAAIDVVGLWSTDFKKVHATAAIKSVLPGESYKIEYALIADSLTGTTKGWRQQNYYVQYSPSQLPEDLQFLATAGSTYYPVFNDVAIAVAKTSQTTAPGALALNETVENTCVLSMPTDATLSAAITRERVAVVALLIDSKGKIVNASRFYIKDVMPDAITLIQQEGTTDAQHYSLEGHKLPQAKKGLNIVRMPDGSTRKVVIK